MSHANGFALAARQAKAQHIADLLQAWGYRSHNCAGWSEEQWRLSADAARQKFPSPETQSLIIKMLKERELAAVPRYGEERHGSTIENAQR